MSGVAMRCWPGGDEQVVLLHSGVTDQRSWYDVASLLQPEVTVWSYDRPGYGQTHSDADGDLADLLARIGPAWLVGNSMGGGLAIDAALTYPRRVRGLVLIAPAVGGAPMPTLTEAEQAMSDLMDAAYDADDLDEQNRLEAHFWLDGPDQPEGRISGATRTLFLDMNRVALSAEPPKTPEAWDRLGELDTPVTVACGALDAPYQVTRARALADHLPHAKHVELPGVAHLPALERPELVADLILGALRAG